MGKQNPFTPPTPAPENDDRPIEEKAKFMDSRDDGTKLKLIKEVFSRFDKSQRNCVSRAELIMGFNSNPQMLISRFPKHCTEILRSLEKMDKVNHKNGMLTFEDFSTTLMQVLSEPGGR